MAEILVTSSELRKTAEELQNLNNQFKQKTEDLTGKENELNGMWDGQANDAFHAAFTKDKGQWDVFSNTITEYANALIQIAQKYDQAESINTQTATTRSY